jgi:hypothetical protein
MAEHGDAIQHARHHYLDYIGTDFDVHQAAAAALLDVSNLDAAAVQWMPTIVDFSFLPHMGGERELAIGRRNYLFARH